MWYSNSICTTPIAILNVGLIIAPYLEKKNLSNVKIYFCKKIIKEFKYNN